MARESLGFYRALVVGAIYEFSAPRDVSSAFTYTHALRQCIYRHPQLGCTVARPETDSPYYKGCARLDLRQHVEMLPQCDERDGLKSIQEFLPAILDAPWSHAIPAWKITVVPFSRQRCFVAFSFSHSLGDGMSGIAFHRTLLDALQDHVVEKDWSCVPPPRQLDPPFDTSANLPISWSFLLPAALPKRIASVFGLGASTGLATPGTWTASNLFYDPERHRTGVEMLSIDAATVEEALKICRSHDGKMTGLLHQLIVNALSESFAVDDSLDNLVARTAINLRGPVGKSNDEMGNFISGVSQIYTIKKSTGSEMQQQVDWASVQEVTEKLAAAAKELRDQPVGLLRYLSDVRSWVSSKLGARRACSYEISNLISFRPLGATERCSVAEMVFCQPADVLGGALTVNVVSVANGPLSLAISWQLGALGLESEDDEKDFVGEVCRRIGLGFTRLMSSSRSMS